MAGWTRTFPYTIIGMVILVVERVISLEKKIWQGIHLAVGGSAVAVLLLYRDTIYSGGKLFANALFKASETAGAYEYEYFTVSLTPAEQERAILFFVILSLIVMAVITAQIFYNSHMFLSLLLLLVMVAVQIYLGAFVAPLYWTLMIGGLVFHLRFCFEEDQNASNSIGGTLPQQILFFGCAIMIACVLFGIDKKSSIFENEKIVALHNYTERIRDTLGDRVQNQPGDVSDGDVQAADGQSGRSQTSSSTGDSSNQEKENSGNANGGFSSEVAEVLSRNVASILSEPVNWLLVIAYMFAAVIFLQLCYRLLRRNSAVRKRKRDIFSGENSLACQALVRYLMALLFCCGIKQENKAYSHYAGQVKNLLGENQNYETALELWHRAAYSDKEIRSEEIQWLREYVEGVKRELLSGLGMAKKWELYMKHFL